MMSCSENDDKPINALLTVLTVSTVKNMGQGHLSTLAASRSGESGMRRHSERIVSFGVSANAK